MAGSIVAGQIFVSPVHLLSMMLAVLSDAAFAFIVGTLLAGHWLEAPTHVTSPALDDPALGYQVFKPSFQRGLLIVGVAVLILTHLVHPWFLAASMSGSDLFGVNLRIIPMMLSSTHQGTLWYVNTVALSALLVATVLGSRRSSLIATVTSVCVIAFVKAASGHAADDGILTLTELCQFLHILSTAVWAGAILVSGFLIVPRIVRSAGIEALWRYVSRLSKTVTWALGGLLISGIYTSDRELNNSLAALRTSMWGKILVIKLIFVAATIVLGALNRLLYVNRPPTSERSSLMKNLIATEALLMLCILCLSGLLGSTAPPMADM